jgi:hypothetical protein
VIGAGKFFGDGVGVEGVGVVDDVAMALISCKISEGESVWCEVP